MSLVLRWQNSFDRLAYWMSMARLHCNTPELFSLVLANKADSDEAKRQVSADMVQVGLATSQCT